MVSWGIESRLIKIPFSLISMPLVQAVKRAKRVFLCGNGGSAANAVHIANDWISVGIKAQALTADVATLTAIANDFGYENVFSRQLEVLAERGDLLVILSGSGNSKNILKALETAKKKGIKSWAIVGGGRALQCSDRHILTESNMQSSEEEQLRIGHGVMWWLKRHQA